MKTLLMIAVSCCAVAGTLLFGEEKTAKDSQVLVTYVSPEKFTDFTSSGFGQASEKDLKYLTALFTAHLEKVAKQFLAPDERLEVTLKDIDLAGRYEPERGPGMQDVRIYRDTTYPRMTLFFRLRGPDGQVRAEGDRTLKDLSYNMNLLPPSGDSEYRHDKALLSEWIRKEFKKNRT